VTASELYDDAVLRYVGTNAHPSPETAWCVGHGKAALNRLVRAGLVQTDPEWSGGLVLTGTGTARLAGLDGGRSDDLH
jgi:hypothetical protein